MQIARAISRALRAFRTRNPLGFRPQEPLAGSYLITTCTSDRFALMQREMTIERLEEIARNALLGGYGRQRFWKDREEGEDPRLASRPRRLVELELSMDCTDPKEIVLFSRLPAKHGNNRKPMTVIIHTRCRKCENCRKRRAMFWQARAVHEWGISPMTYFGTLTTAPKLDLEADAEIQRDEWKRGTDFARLSEQERFALRVKYLGRHVTKYLKRVREGRGPFRYLIVAEMHNSQRTGSNKRFRPHWHCLIHEVQSPSLLTLPHEWAIRSTGERATDKYGNPYLANDAYLKRQWAEIGHSTFALCRSRFAAAYVCKYLTKEDSLVRVRNSFRYGGEANEASPPTGADSEALRSEAETSGKIDDPQRGTVIRSGNDA